MDGGFAQHHQNEHNAIRVSSQLKVEGYML